MIATIDLGGTFTKYGLVRDGKVLSAASCPSGAGGAIAKHLELVLGQLRSMCREHGVSLPDCQGLGVLSTGLVDNQKMRVLSTNGKYDDATDFDFCDWGTQQAGLELKLENDARGALLGEWHYGAGRGVNDLVMVTLGTGIGTAVISGGRVLTGPNYSAGILGGHLQVKPGGRRCTCGASGCLESEASGWVLPELLKENPNYQGSPLADMSSVGFKELMDQASAGDACAVDVMEHLYNTWGSGLAAFIQMFDPERLIVGGGIMNAADDVLGRFREIISQMAWGKGQQVELVPAQHPNHAGLIGAAALFENS